MAYEEEIAEFIQAHGELEAARLIALSAEAELERATAAVEVADRRLVAARNALNAAGAPHTIILAPSRRAIEGTVLRSGVEVVDM